jgi:peroxiredoxin
MVFTAFLWRDVRALRRELSLFTGNAGTLDTATSGACPGLGVGSDAPPLVLPDTEGDQISLADYKGRYVLLVFSSTRCSFCVELYDDLKIYDQEFRSDDMVMLLVSLSTKEENRALKQSEGVNFPVLTATEDVFRSFSIPGTPTLVLVDKEGKTRACNVANRLEQIVQFVNFYR